MFVKQVVFQVFQCLLFSTMFGCGQFLPKTSNLNIIHQHPNLNSWTQVYKGMKKPDVQKLLGSPRTIETSDASDGVEPVEAWIYGMLKYDAQSLPTTYYYRIWFSGDCVDDVEDPFQGCIYTDKPIGAIKLILPGVDAKFEHFPRIIDFRWQPVMADSLVFYEVQLSAVSKGMQDGFDVLSTAHKYIVNEPYLAYEAKGVSSYAWRVRACTKNTLGEWSETRNFTCFH